MSRSSTLDQTNEGGTAKREQCRTAKLHQDIQLGAVIATVAVAVMLALFFLHPINKGGINLHLAILALFAFTSFLGGMAFILLSMNMLALPAELVSRSHETASKCLFFVCTASPVLTLLSLLALLPKPHLYTALAVVVTIVVPFTAVHWYLGSKADKGDEAAAYEEHKEELEHSFNLTSGITSSAFGGLVGALFSVYKGPTGKSGSISVAVAIFFMFCTGIFGLFLMPLSPTILKISNQRLRGFIIRAMGFANVFMLVSLATAALAASSMFLKYYLIAALFPVALAFIVWFVIEHCSIHADRDDRTNREAQLKWMAEMASKVTTFAFGAIMSIFAGVLGNGDGKDRYLRICMFLLTSSYCSGLSLMLLTIKPDPTKASVGAAATILVWSAMGLLAVAALSMYCVEVLKA